MAVLLYVWSLFVVFLFHGYSCYKPVVFVHGLFGNRHTSKETFEWLQQSHFGTKTYSVDLYENLKSMEAMVKQEVDVNAEVEQYMQKHPEGIHLVCYSQGGLLCRSVLQQTKHNVDTFIALSSPLAGQFGKGRLLGAILMALQGHLCKDFELKVAINCGIAYTKTAQEDLSVANYWNDPRHQDLYRKFNMYLAFLNNDTYNSKAEEWKTNFLRLNKMVLIGGPDDEVITPWQSSHFGFFDENLSVLNMTQMPFYQYDTFGLQTMVKRNAVYLYTQDQVFHNDWVKTKSVFEKYVLPHLT